MENTRKINDKIAENLIYYRKRAGLTQAELAEKINYSDKSVSKWESAGGVPDIYILLELSKLYGVSIDELVRGEVPEKIEPIVERKKGLGKRVWIMLLSSGLVWLVATCLFVGFYIWNSDSPAWLIFLYAVFANAIVLIVYTGLWKYRILNFLSVSTLIWITITCLFVTLHLTFENLSLGFLFLIGIPLQILEIFWAFFRSLFKRKKQV
ncbi:MAG: helix-turn-helix transcriptional regulator [Clostridia bacterium]|nr:helix-turn-helix transcriptional regulator [Clostridia bacterium]